VICPFAAIAALVLLLAASACGGGSSSAHPSALVIGDSLTVGVEPDLAALLRGWKLRVDGRTGRPTSEAARIVASTALPDRVAFLLGTNDPPDGNALLRELDAILRRLPPHGCLVTATIARPATSGAGYEVANAKLRALARADARVRLIDWSHMTQTHPRWLAADPEHVHPSAAGYEARARALASALRSCSAETS
jgi:lysophospholipase L1-like esterase